MCITFQSNQRKFYNDLQSVIDSVNKDDVLVLINIGDFNARVGSSKDMRVHVTLCGTR